MKKRLCSCVNINSVGKIIERWINATSASKYDIGENATSTIVLTSDNLSILLPNDKESLNLYGKRVFIDKRTPPEKVYKITRSDDVLYDYGEHGGVVSFIADKTEFNPNTDRQDLKLCDYIDGIYECFDEDNDVLVPIPNEAPVSSVNISGSRTLKVGIPRTYDVAFMDKMGNKIDCNDILFKWNIDADFVKLLNQNNDTIELLVDDESCIDKSFVLSVVMDEKSVADIEITIIEFM